MLVRSVLRLFPKLTGYKLARHGLIRPPHPVFLNFSVTNKCQSKCTMCNIWRIYKKYPAKKKEELKLWEIEKIFKSMGKVYTLAICGGEPFLRDDLDEICRLACKYIKPLVIHSPTNCLDPKRIRDITERILQKIPRDVLLTIKLSLDGVGKKHDKIRGVKGNFNKLLKTHDYLVELRKRFPNLYLDAGVTVSKKNLADLDEMNEYVNENLKLDNWLHEIADTRAELFNTSGAEKVDKKFGGAVKDLEIKPTGKEYSGITKILIDDVKKNLKNSRRLSKLIQVFRIVYYKRAAKVMNREKRVLPCFAGISNAHINPWGGLWICNVQAFNKEIGNLKDYDYNFDKIWNSKSARRVRKWVKSDQCYCPLAGQGFLDTLMHPKELIKVIYYFFGGLK